MRNEFGICCLDRKYLINMGTNFMNVIGVFPANELARRRRLFDALARLYTVDFVGLSEVEPPSVGAAILFDVDRQHAVRCAESGLRCLAFLNASEPVSLPPGNVILSSTSYLDRCFRGRVLADKALNRAFHLKADAQDEVVARREDSILWIHCQCGASAVDLVAMESPNLADDGFLFDHFQRDDWIRFLPILHFLREVSGWEPPPLRACFMFDDPNLHWNSYGFIRYASLAQSARENNYHVSCAAVPLDGWYVHRPTATLFQKNQQWLSLLIHGNNHITGELAKAYTEPVRRALAAQALLRIGRLEQVSGLEVPRVMAAPHGACSQDMATVLLQMGFEAACISRGSIMHHNPGSVWPLGMGLNPTEFMGAGLPVIPRFRLHSDCEINMLMAVFLGQPVIPVGHHEDVAGGLDLLAQLAGTLNSIGEVQWMNLKSIARSNFCTRRHGKVLHVKMFSRRIHLKVPPGINQLCVHRPWLNDGASEALELRPSAGNPALFSSYLGEPMATESCKDIEIHAIPADAIDPRAISLSRTPLWAILRRQMCEARDRLKPVYHRLFVKN
jgi:hypothetical protein